jgi:hypothetical protein
MADNLLDFSDRRIMPSSTIRFVTHLFRVSALLLSVALGSAAVVYDFALPANGDIDTIAIQVTVPSYLSGGLTVFMPGDPGLTSFSSGAMNLELLAFGILADPTETRVGVAIVDDSGLFAALNRDLPDDFFVFNRGASENGVYTSVSGTIEADPIYTLATTTPTAQLVVTVEPIPEPMSLLTFATGALSLLALRRARRL